jgi:hypothetical protein
MPDRNRWILFELKSRDPTKPGIVKSQGVLGDLGKRQLAVAIDSARRATELYDQLRAVEIPGVDNRQLECYAVPTAALAAAAGRDTSSTVELLKAFLAPAEKLSIEDSDERSLLAAILQSTVECGRGERLTVGQIIASQSRLQDHADQLEASGVRVVAMDSVGSINAWEHSGPKGLFVTKLAERKLLRNTEWEAESIEQILRRLPGAAKTRRRIAGSRSTGVLLSPEQLEESGAKLA